MRWGDYIKRTAVRRVAWIVVGVLVYAVLGWFADAQAQARSCPSGGDCSRQEAYAAAMQRSTNFIASGACGQHGGEPLVRGPFNTQTNWPFYVSSYQCYDPNGNLGSWTNTPAPSNHYYPSGDECPVGTEWRDDLKQCFDPSECLARNQQPGFGVPTTRPWASSCRAGCMLAMDSSQGYSCTTHGGKQVCSGSLTWTGDTCSPDPQNPEELEDEDTSDDPKERCEWFGGEAGAGGQNFCKKPDGRECYTIQGGNRAGQQVCWRPGEAGRKVSGDTAITRAPGPTEPPPPDPPPGEHFEKVAESVTTTTTNTTGGSSSSSTVTARQDRTHYGTDAGGPGAPDQSEGAGGGEGEEGEGSFSGGADCGAEPACSGDPILCGIAKQQWLMRCDGYDTGLDDLDYTGWNASVDSIIADAEADGDGPTDGIWTDEDGDPFEGAREVRDENWMVDQLDNTRFLTSAGCPTVEPFTVAGVSVPINLAPLCNLLSSMAGLVIALAYFIAFRIMAGAA